MKKLLIGMAAILLGATSAYSADLYYDPPVDPPIDPSFCAGCYLRGHLGMSNQRFKGLRQELFSAVEIHEFLDKGGFNSAPLAGLGFGYKFNNFLRADAFVEYRGKADFSALDRYGHTEPTGTVWDGTNDYDGAKSEWLLMANAYVDIGEWHGVTPYVGAGIGASRNTISHFRDINVPTQGVAYADSASTWNLAWALHAGLAFKASERLTVDLGYTYVDLGDAKTGRLKSYDGTVNNAPMYFENITSHDIKLGLRYSFQ